MSRLIVIYGASGTTGGLVAAELVRRGFEVGVHYLDVSGEQAFLREVHEQHDSPARRAGIAAAPGFAWEVAIGDWAASRAAALCREEAGADVADADDDGDSDADRDVLDEVVIGYALSRVRASPASWQGLVGTLSRPTSVWREDRWDSAVPLSRTRRIAFPPPFGERDALLWPAGEVITVPRHIAARRVEGFLTLGEEFAGIGLATRLAALVGPLLSLAAASPLGALARARAGAAPPPGEEARRRIEFAIVAEALLRFRRARVSVSGTDPYALSARIAALGVERLAGGPGSPPPPSGVLAPSELTDP